MDEVLDVQTLDSQVLGRRDVPNGEAQVLVVNRLVLGLARRLVDRATLRDASCLERV